MAETLSEKLGLESSAEVADKLEGCVSVELIALYVEDERQAAVEAVVRWLRERERAAWGTTLADAMERELLAPPSPGESVADWQAMRAEAHRRVGEAVEASRAGEPWSSPGESREPEAWHRSNAEAWAATFFTAGPLRDAARAGIAAAVGEIEEAQLCGLAARRQERQRWRALESTRPRASRKEGQDG